MSSAPEAQVATGPYCMKCGRQTEADSVYCRFCGSPVLASTSASPHVAQPAEGPKPAHTVRRILVYAVFIAVIAVVVVILALIYVPVPRSFSASIPMEMGHAGYDNLSFPSNVRVSGTWDTSNGAPVAWCSIFTQPGGLIYISHSGISGSFSFTATYSTYEFECVAGSTNSTVDLSGTYSMPLA